jgi:hypothetical protein
MRSHEQVPSWVVAPHIPNVARMYDYYLGGKDNFAADREAAEQVIAAMPYVLQFTKANRGFLARAVTLMAQQGVRQFLDLGSGLPTQENTHEVAQRVGAESRVVYVDNDPIVLTHGRALLAGDSHTVVVQADLRDPQSVLAHSEVREILDFNQPVGVLLLATLHFVTDDALASSIVAQLRERLVSGSYLAITHGYAGQVSKEIEDQVRGAYQATAAGDLVPRTLEQVTGYFDGMQILEPGVVHVEAWRPVLPVAPDPSRAGFLAAVGRVR